MEEHIGYEINPTEICYIGDNVTSDIYLANLNSGFSIQVNPFKQSSYSILMEQGQIIANMISKKTMIEYHKQDHFIYNNMKIQKEQLIKIDI